MQRRARAVMVSLAAVGTLAVAVLIGWVFDVAVLKAVIPGQGTMKPNTALSLLFLAIASYWAFRGSRRGARWWAAPAFALGGISLLQDLTSTSIGIDTLLFQDPDSPFTLSPGRMSPASALSFMLLATGLMIRRDALEQATAPVAALIATAALGGYLFAATPFTGATLVTTGMAIHTALGVILLSVAHLRLHPDQGWVGAFSGRGLVGDAARRIVPAIIMVPLIVALVARLGILLGWWDPNFALSVQLVATLAILVAIVGWGLRRLGETDRSKEAAREALEQLNQELEVRVEERAQELSQERTRFKVLAEEAPLGILHTDAEGICVYANPAWLQIVGLDAAQVEGQAWAEVIHPDDRKRVRTAWQRAAEAGSHFQDVVRVRRRHAGLRWVVIHVGPVRDQDGRVTGHVATAEDVTGRRKLERRLQETVQFRDAILAASQDHIYVYDKDLRYLYANPAGPASLGLSPEDLVGKHWSEVGFPAEIMAPFEQKVRRVFQTGEPLVDRTSFPLPGGEGWFEYALAPIQDPAGNVVRVAAVTRDITERVAVEKSERELERRHTELRSAEEEARFKGEFLNLAAHELATPMTPIVLQLAVLRHELAGSPGALKSVHRIERNVERLQSLADNLLAAARVQAREWHVDVAPLDAADIVNAVSKRHAAAFAEASVELQVQALSAPVLGDRPRLEDALDHLLWNALKFTPEGGHVTVGCRREGDQVIIDVRDDGAGIETERIDELFRPFTQVHEPASVTHLGAGLGLYITKGIVEAHGGEIGIDSPGPGKGTHAWFKLPVDRAPSRPPRPSRVAEAPVASAD